MTAFKHRAVLLAALASAGAFLTVPARADVDAVNGIEWTFYVKDGGAVVGTDQWQAAIPYETSGDIVVPETLGGYPVTEIGYAAFLDRYDITSIILPGTVKGVSSYAFYYCSATNVCLTEGLEWIGYNSFCNSRIQTIRIPDSVTNIGYRAFAGCNGLKSIEIPSSVSFIGEGAFSGCSSLSGITVANGNRSYASADGVLFKADMTMLLTYPNGRPGSSYVVPDGVSIIGERAFSSSGLSSIQLPGTLKMIGGAAFEGCRDLLSIQLPDGLETIEWSAFHYCSSLQTIDIPASVTAIDGNVFLGCSSLSSISVSPSNGTYASDGGALFTKDGKTGLSYPPGGPSAAYSIPAGVERIGSYMFYYASNLRRVDIPESVTSLGYMAFAYCGLEDVIVPPKAACDSEAFYSCLSLTNVVVSSGVPSIPSYAFYGCSSLKAIRLPSSMTSIDYSFFGCDALETIYLGGNSPVTDEDFHDAGVPETCAIVRLPVPVLSDDRLVVYATEGVASHTSLSVTGGTSPYAWTLLPGGYAENSKPSSFSDVGVSQGWNQDDSCEMLLLPFSFPYFGETYDRCYVSDNGTISFGSSFSRYWFDEASFRSIPIIAAHWADLYGDDMDVYIESESGHVTIRWSSTYWGNTGAANFSATLFPNGKIVLSFGNGNAKGGVIGLSAGDGETQIFSTKSESGSMDNAPDIVFEPVSLPDGLSLSAGGVLSGTCDEPGEYRFGVSVSDANGETAVGVVRLFVEENPALRPALTSFSPSGDYLNLADKASQYFLVSSSHPSGGTVEYEWTLDGEPVGSRRVYTYHRPEDGECHVVRVVLSAADLPKTASHEWRAGVLVVTDPESVIVSYGRRASLSVAVTSSLPASVTWHDALADGESVGEGETLRLPAVTEDGSYFAVARNAFGAVTSAVATVTVDPTPAVGRIYKMTGPAFVGNRLVLRAKVFGDPTGATFAWKRDGTTVATTERLDIPSLSASDFGTYTLTATTPYGTATSEPFVLAEAQSGVPVGWGASGSGRTTAPEGESGFAQVASGMNFNLGLKTDGTVVAWGYNGHGGCDVPDGLSGVSFVAAGGYESQGAGFAVKTDGTVVAWGQPAEIYGYWDWRWVDDYDEYGDWIGEHEELCWYGYTNGWDTVSTMPAGLSDVVQVAVGYEFAIALKADGSVVTWGLVDDDDYRDWNEAVPDYVDDVVAVAAGRDFAMVLLADGTAFPFGRDCSDPNDADMRDVVFDDAIGVGTMKGSFWLPVFAIRSDGVVEGRIGLGFEDGVESVPVTNAVALDCGEYHAIALGKDGGVFVGIPPRNAFPDFYNICGLPAAVQGNAIGIAAGGYHCTALLPDADGDTISDAEEILLGRDPNVWEDWHRASLSGIVTIGGGDPATGALVSVYDASGRLVGRASTDEGGFYEIEGLVPANYFVSVEAAGAADAWAGDALPPGFDGDLAPGVPWESGGAVPVAVGEGAPACDFDLAPGELAAWARVEADKWTIESDEGDWEEVALPAGTKVYLDMWPVEADDDLAFDLGEVAASHSALDGLVLLPHAVTARRPEPDAQIPSPDLWVTGEEGSVVAATPSFSGESGAITIVTDPAGAEVWIDYADESLGVTPLTVDNLAAGASHCHVLLLRKEGYLRPRPVEFELAIGEENEISIPLSADSEPAMSVEVSSGIPGLPIYLDYLPTEQVTPVTVGGMDPASHAGDLWHSASHSILLRDERLRPFAPRAVPEPAIDWETGEPVLGNPAGMFVVAPNSYDDSDGDGIRNDIEVAGGTDPFDGTDGDYTRTTPVPVPYKWIDQYPDLLAAHGGDYEEAAFADPDGDGYETWREFVAGTDPTDRESVFRATISLADGVPDVRCEPYLPAIRRYTIEAASALGERFVPVDDADDGSDIRFYRVRVRLP